MLDNFSNNDNIFDLPLNQGYFYFYIKFEQMYLKKKKDML